MAADRHTRHSCRARSKHGGARLLALLAALFTHALAPSAVGAERSDAGVYLIWHRPDAPAVALPAVRGGQLVRQWAQVEPEKGRYDFSFFERGLEALAARGKKATLQINAARHPAYLGAEVPVIPHRLRGNARSAANPVYWSEHYVERHARLIAALGRYLSRSPYRDAVLAVRQNYNGVGTEHLAIPKRWRSPSSWQVPPTAVGPMPERWRPSTARRYQARILGIYLDTFYPDGASGRPVVPVLMRANVLSHGYSALPATLRMRIDALLDAGLLGLFKTHGEPEPSTKFYARTAAVMAEWCARTFCYSESVHAGAHAKGFSRVQWNYWRYLMDLSTGVSYIASRGNPKEEIGRFHAESAEDRATYAFANRYAGTHRDARSAPGAWIAFRGARGHWREVGDYGFLAHRRGPDVSVALARPGGALGPEGQRYGAFARHIPAGSAVTVELDERFAASLSGLEVELHVIYLDEGGGVLALDGLGANASQPVGRTGRWLSARWPITVPVGGERSTGLSVRAVEEGVTVHLLEVRRLS